MREHKPLGEKLTPDELQAIYDQSSPRVVAIVLCAIAENHLAECLKLLMLQDAKAIKEQFKPDGTLGPFGNKIKLAYLLRVIDDQTMHDLVIASRIRNKFAHDLSIKSMDDQKICSLIRSMHIYSILQSIELRTREEAKPGLIFKVKCDILKFAMGNWQDGFTLCMRMLIHGIADREEEIGRTGALLAPFQPLEALPEKFLRILPPATPS